MTEQIRLQIAFAPASTDAWEHLPQTGAARLAGLIYATDRVLRFAGHGCDFTFYRSGAVLAIVSTADETESGKIILDLLKMLKSAGLEPRHVFVPLTESTGGTASIRRELCEAVAREIGMPPPTEVHVGKSYLLCTATL